MCGIAGIYNFTSNRTIQEKVLNDMADAIIHRGPDDSAIIINGNLGLAFRRLSITSLSTVMMVK
jgi:asparagine synthase (glutamine-hydrolysing)